MLRSAASFSIVMLVCSCTTYRINTPSGRPETTVHASMPQAKSAAIGAMAAHEYNLTAQASNVLTFQSQMTTGDATIYLLAVGNSNYSMPTWISRLTFIESGPNVKILGNVEASATSPFGQVSNTDTTRGRSGQSLQAILQSIPGQLH